MPIFRPSAICLVAVALVVALVLASGCSSPAGGHSDTLTPSPASAPSPEPILNDSAINNLETPGISPTAGNISRPLLSRTFAVLSGGKPIVIDPEEYGCKYFSIVGRYTLSIDSARPVNILVLDSLYSDRLSQYAPDYGIRPSLSPDRSVSFSYGFMYNFPLVVQEDNVVKKTVTFSVPRSGKYLVVIDPRFHGKVTWDMYGNSISHDYFRTTLELATTNTSSTPHPEDVPRAVNEVIGLPTGYVGTTKVYPLDEYGFSSLSPGDSLHLSVSTGKPVNILVLDSEAMEAFSRVDPIEGNIQNRTVDAVHRGYSYGEISPNNGEVFHEDGSFDTEAFVEIPKTSKYFVVIDPRFSYEFSSMEGYPSIYTEDFVTAKVYIEVVREGSPLYWKKLGDFSLRKGEYVAAESYYRRSLELDPENPDTWYNLGLVLRDLGDYRGAIDAFNQTLRIQPGDADVWEKIGILYLLIENEGAARDAYNRSLIR